MDYEVYKISILRVVDEKKISKKEIVEVEDIENQFVSVTYQRGVFILLDNPDYYQTLIRKRVSEINVAIRHQEIPTIREHILMRLKREKLNPMLASILYYELSSICKLKQRQISEELNITQGAISNKKRLMMLPYFVQVKIIDGSLKERHARAILQLKDYPELCPVVLKEILDNNLTVVETQNLVYKYLGKPIIAHKTLSIKKLDENLTNVKPEAKIAVNHVNSEMSKAIEKINKFFPNLDIEFELGSDREDVIFLLKLKGTCDNE